MAPGHKVFQALGGRDLRVDHRAEFSRYARTHQFSHDLFIKRFLMLETLRLSGPGPSSAVPHLEIYFNISRSDRIDFCARSSVPAAVTLSLNGNERYNVHCVDLDMTNQRFSAVSAVTLFSAVLGACSHSATAPTSGVSLVTAQPVAPANGAQVPFYKQPVILIISNGTASTAGVSVTNQIDVATDDAFSNIVQVKDVPQDASGQTKIPVEQLSGSTTYFWRVRTTASTTVGPFSSVFRFVVGPKVTIQAPQPVRPLQGAVEGARPTFVVANAQHAGPVGGILYHFDVATDPAFGSIVANGTVTEAQSQTSFTPSDDLQSGVTFYWRAQALDASTGVMSSYTATSSFRTPFMVVPGPYRMSLSPVAGGCGPVEAYPRTYTFDGTLDLIGSRFKFTTSRPVPIQPVNPMVLDVTRTGDSLVGGLFGGPSIDRQGYLVSAAVGFRPPHSDQPLGPAPATGAVTNASTLAGTIDGALHIVHKYYGLATDCAGAHSWTVTAQ